MFEKLIVHNKNKALTLAPPPHQLDNQSRTQQLFFCVEYHPKNMKSFEYQQAFKGNILKPK